MKIVLIEDEEALRQNIQELLELHGHEVGAAADGETGVALAEAGADLVLCDVGLPGMSGHDVLRVLRERTRTRDLPFIFLTARADRSDQRAGMALGADDYITKPFTEKELIEAIEARARRHASLRARLEEVLAERRREFGAPWSHELLTPLNGVLGGLELLEAEAEGTSPEELRELLALVRAGAERQRKLSAKLIRFFELGRIREGLDASPDERCSPADIVARGAHRAASAAGGEARLRLRVSDGPELALPGFYLTDAIAELVENAFAHSPREAPVTVEAEASGLGYRVSVTDSGRGMSETERAATGPFVRFSRPREVREGLGLGLAIARETARLGGGTLRLEPGPAGLGLSAVIELPAAPARVRQPEATGAGSGIALRSGRA